MATNLKQPRKKTAENTLKGTAEDSLAPSAESSKAGLVLEDCRIRMVNCQRLIPPEQATRGSYVVTISPGEVQFGDTPEGRRMGSFDYNVHIEGYVVSKPGGKIGVKSPKSFSASITMEGVFFANGGIEQDPKLLQSWLSIITSQVHITAIERARACVNEMGFRAVRPSIGIHHEVLASMGEIANITT